MPPSRYLAAKLSVMIIEEVLAVSEANYPRRTRKTALVHAAHIALAGLQATAVLAIGNLPAAGPAVLRLPRGRSLQWKASFGWACRRASCSQPASYRLWSSWPSSPSCRSSFGCASCCRHVSSDRRASSGPAGWSCVMRCHQTEQKRRATLTEDIPPSTCK